MHWCKIVTCGHAHVQVQKKWCMKKTNRIDGYSIKCCFCLKKVVKRYTGSRSNALVQNRHVQSRARTSSKKWCMKKMSRIDGYSIKCCFCLETVVKRYTGSRSNALIVQNRHCSHAQAQVRKQWRMNKQTSASMDTLWNLVFALSHVFST